MSNAAPPVARCISHVDNSKWIEVGQRDAAGNIRVVCSLCNTFIGYRPRATAEPAAVQSTVKEKKHGKSKK